MAGFSFPSWEEYLTEWRKSHVDDAVHTAARYFYDQDYKQAYDDYVKGEIDSTWSGLTSGKLNPYDAQASFASLGAQLTPEQNEVLNNFIARQAAADQVQGQKDLQANSTQSVIDVLKDNGMNPGSVISMGSTGSGNAAFADTSTRNIAQEKYLQSLSNKFGIARSLISLIGGLGSAGIGGTALYLAKNAASKLAASTAHSAESVIKYSFDRFGNPRGHQIIDRRWS